MSLAAHPWAMWASLWGRCARYTSTLSRDGPVISASSISPVQLTTQKDYVCLCVPTPPAPVLEETAPTGGRGEGHVGVAVLSELEDWWLLEHARQARLCTVDSPQHDMTYAM